MYKKDKFFYNVEIIIKLRSKVLAEDGRVVLADIVA